MVSSTPPYQLNERIGMLSVAEIFEGVRGFSYRLVCDCGGEVPKAKGCQLRRGAYKSCGCANGRKPLVPGTKYGRLTVVRQAEGKNNTRQWLCKCDCGNDYTGSTKALRGGHTRGCGCLVKKHGKSHSKVYAAWRGIKKRTRRPNTAHYERYGGHGIKMCDRWYDSFENFYADMGEPPTASHSIDRIDCDGHYEPGNCRWASAVIQNNNRRGYNTRLTWEGKTQTLSQWSREMGIKKTTLSMRLYKYKWDVAKALSTPVRSKRSKTSA